MLEQGLTSCCWVLLKAATDVKPLSVAVEKIAGTVAAVENAWSSSVGDACSSHLKLVTEDRMRHHQKVVAQHASLVMYEEENVKRCEGEGREKGGLHSGVGLGGLIGGDRTSSLGQQKLYSDGLVYGFVI